MKPLILLAFSDLGTGGVQTKIISLANALVTKGARVWIILGSQGAHSRMHLLDSRVRIIIPLDISFFGKHPFWGWRFSLFVACVALVSQPKTVFVSLAPLSVWVLRFFSYIAPWMCKRTIVNEDTFPSLYYNGDYVYGVEHDDIRRWYPLAKYVIAVSKSTFEDLKHNFNIASPPLVYIPNWTPVEIMGNASPQRTIDIVYAGRMAKQKRPKVLAEVLCGVSIKRSHLKVFVYADGPMMDDFQAEIRRLGMSKRIVVLGTNNNIKFVLSKAKILLFTSKFEGMPFVGLEAMALGTVIAGLYVPGVRDIVENEKTGVLARSKDQLIEKVIAYIDNPEKLSQLRKNSLQKVKSEFSIRNRDALVQLMLKYQK